MSGEIVVSETPNWLNALEAKRERRVKARLGHETGAGAPCLKCGDACPGLDLHFWRKACKICRCPKEEHDVPDDDIYGWAQFQLLGSKPNKIKTKINLPGRNGEVELEWAPKGQKEIIDDYLKTLPPEALPVKGSQAAQERKQLLQKQIPVHDIDPTLCHELNEEEVAKMEDYIAHIKKSSVGVGQIVNLSNLIKASLINMSPEEAECIASRYSQGVPYSELVKIQAGIAQKLQNLSLSKKPLPKMQPTKATTIEDTMQASPASKYRDLTHPWYASSSQTINPQYSENYNPRKDYNIDQNLLKGTNFNPALTPGQFMPKFDTPQKFDSKFGYENPYFNRQLEEAQQIKAPKSVKDLIYSTYDAQQGPIPEDRNETKSYDLPHYDPAPLNTYKHDPSVIPPRHDEFTEFDPISLNYIDDSGKQLPPSLLRQLYPTTLNPATSELIEEILRSPAKFKDEIKTYGTTRVPPHLAAQLPAIFNALEDMQRDPGEIKKTSVLAQDPDPATLRNITEMLKDPVKYREGLKHYGLPNLPPMLLRELDPEALKYIQDMQTDPEKYVEGLQKYGTTSMPSSLAVQIPDILKYLNVSPKKPSPTLTPNKMNICEDNLQPQYVKIGAIKDIDVKTAMTQPNVNFNDDEAYVVDDSGNVTPEGILDILQNIQLPDCHHCKKPFKDDEFAVTIDRANVLFHAQCFKCAGCNQSLADNIYFYHKESDNVYCGRDYAKIKGYPRCAACDELIFTKEYCLAENATFHLKHFCCFQCDSPLAGQDYTLEEDKPYCLPCYETSKAAKCGTCGKVIKTDETGCQLKDVHFHAEDKCFRCFVCGLPLMGKKLLLRNEKLYCSHECFNMGQY